MPLPQEIQEELERKRREEHLAGRARLLLGPRADGAHVRRVVRCWTSIHGVGAAHE